MKAKTRPKRTHDDMANDARAMMQRHFDLVHADAVKAGTDPSRTKSERDNAKRLAVILSRFIILTETMGLKELMNVNLAFDIGREVQQLADAAKVIVADTVANDFAISSTTGKAIKITPLERKIITTMQGGNEIELDHFADRVWGKPTKRGAVEKAISKLNAKLGTQRYSVNQGSVISYRDR